MLFVGELLGAPKVALACAAAEDQVVITVRDNGEGVPPDRLETIFVPFYTSCSEPAAPGLRGSAMAKVVGIDHLAIRVGDFEASVRFYDRLLSFLGFVREWEFDRTVGWNNGVTMLWITEADAEGRKTPHRTGDIGYHHYAFELGARAEVDELGAFLEREGVTIIDPPAAYPSYGEGYYAVFFLDPDGLKLEAMHFREKVKRGGRPPRGL